MGFGFLFLSFYIWLGNSVKMIRYIVEVGSFVMGEGRLIEGFVGEVMLGFVVVWLRRDCMYRDIVLGVGILLEGVWK